MSYVGGIVRRIDDLGRIMIPKEVRKSLGLREGTPLELHVNADGSLLFKKFSITTDRVNAIQNIIESMYTDDELNLEAIKLLKQTVELMKGEELK